MRHGYLASGSGDRTGCAPVFGGSAVPRAAAAVLLVLAVAIPSGVLAAPSVRIADLLRSRPTDRARVASVLKSCLASRSYDDAYPVARYMAKYMGERSARIYEILAVCALRTGDSVRVRPFAEQALALNPSSTVAARVLALTAPPGGGRTGAPGGAAPEVASGFAVRTPSAGGVAGGVAAAGAGAGPGLDAPAELADATRFFYEDRYDRAMASVRRALAGAPDGAAALLLAARIHMARTEFKEAGQVLADAARLHPRDPAVFQRLAELDREVAAVTKSTLDLSKAVEHYAAAQAIRPDHVPSLLGHAHLLYMSGQTAEAERVYARAAAHRPFGDRELVLTDAQILHLRGQTRESLSMLGHYARTFGTDSQSLLHEGVVLLELDRKDEAGECLERAFLRNPRNLPAVLNVVPRLVAMEQADRALRVISAAEAEYPRSKQVAELKEQIKLRVITDRDLVTVERGPFVYTYPRWLETKPGKVLEAIFEDFRVAYIHLSRVMRFKPDRVKVRVLYDTGLDNPAFYSPDKDQITISAQWYFPDEPGAGGGTVAGAPDAPTAAQQRAYAAHMIAHELSHLIFAHRMGIDDYRRVGLAVPLWIQEGGAEWTSGGVQSIGHDTRKVKGFFAGAGGGAGALEYDALEKHMQVVNGAKDPLLNHKAYVQSYFMVKALMAREPTPEAGLDRFFELNRELVRTSGDVAASLAKVYGLSMDGFRKAWTAQIDSDVVRPAEPNLTSMPMMAAGPGTAVVAGDGPAAAASGAKPAP
jgi:tetratricopeptide (TPR) repeat protein